MTLQQLRYFCAIARHASYRKASEELFVSQPTLSAAISALEKEEPAGSAAISRPGGFWSLFSTGQQADNWYIYIFIILSV